MSAHRGPGIRTSRTRAVEIGTDPRGFEGGVPADAQAGVPSGHQGSGSYKDVAEQARPKEGMAPVTIPTPFTLK